MWHYMPIILSQSLYGQWILQEDWWSKDTKKKTQCGHLFHGRRVKDPDLVGCTLTKRIGKWLQRSVWPNLMFLHLFPVYLYSNISLFNNKVFGGTFDHRPTYHPLLSPSKISFLGDSMYAWSLMFTSQRNERERVVTLQCSGLRRQSNFLILVYTLEETKNAPHMQLILQVWYCLVTAHNPFVNNSARTACRALLPPACTFQQKHPSNTNCLMAKYAAKSSLAQILMPSTLMNALSLFLLSIMSPAFPLSRAFLSETLCCPQLLSYLDLVVLRKPTDPSNISTIFIW